MKTILDHAIALHNSGRSIIPTKPDKTPAVKKWKSFQENRPPPEQLKKWFQKQHKCLAIVCGAVSGHLELIDFDIDSNKRSLFPEWQTIVEEEAPGLLKRLVIQVTPSGGFHVCYCCPLFEIPGNLKLAQRTNGTEVLTMIETRGQGGYFLADPSPQYKLKQGDFVSLPQITPQQRDILITSAKKLTGKEFLQPKQEPTREPRSRDSGGDLSPGDDYNERGDIRAYLKSQGWEYVRGPKDEEQWRRPGKKDRGSSANLHDGKSIWIFSSNAQPLEPERSYDLFGLFTTYEHEGDHSAAAKALVKDGYGSQKATNVTDITDHPAFETEETQKKQQKKKPQPRPALLNMEQLGKLFEKEVSYLWRNHIPVAMPVMISAREGDGKSTTCIQIAKEILDEHPEAWIAWIASEGFVSDTINKMEQLGVDQKRFLLLRNKDETFQFNFALSSDLQQVDDVLRTCQESKVNVLAVFVDSIRGISRFDDNESKIKTVMLPLNGIVCDKYGCSLIYIDHFKKGIATNLLDKVVGSTAKAAAVRCVYAITPVGGLVRKISVAKTNILNHRPDELRTALRGDKGLLIYTGEQADHTRRDEAQEWLIKLFSKQAEYLSSEVYSLGEYDGFGMETLKKAKNDLGIDARQEAFGRPWTWVCHRFLDE